MNMSGSKTILRDVARMIYTAPDEYVCPGCGLVVNALPPHCIYHSTVYLCPACASRTCKEVLGLVMSSTTGITYSITETVGVYFTRLPGYPHILGAGISQKQSIANADEKYVRYTEVV